MTTTSSGNGGGEIVSQVEWGKRWHNMTYIQWPDIVDSSDNEENKNGHVSGDDGCADFVGLGVDVAGNFSGRLEDPKH